jgi:hypothetical protein
LRKSNKKIKIEKSLHSRAVQRFAEVKQISRLHQTEVFSDVLSGLPDDAGVLVFAVSVLPVEAALALMPLARMLKKG